jgi:hypothetical protein
MSPEHLGHYLDQLPSLGIAMNTALTESYFALHTTLLRPSANSSSIMSASTSTSLQAALLSLCNLQLTPSDIRYMQKLSIHTFITPLIAFAAEQSSESLQSRIVHMLDNPAVTVEKPIIDGAPFNVRYGAFTLMRLLSYLSADAAAEHEVVSNNTDGTPVVAAGSVEARSLASSLVDEMYKQVSQLLSLRSIYKNQRVRRSEVLAARRITALKEK